MTFNCKITMPDVDKLKKRLKPAQKYIDSEILRKSDPYVPMQTGSLKRSGVTGTKVGSGIIRYTAPYAKKRYRIAKTSGKRGPYWVERMLANHKAEIIRGAQEALEKE